jgi:glutamate synthase (NADPH) small chain
MGKPTGFLEYNRETPPLKPAEERIKDYAEFYLPFDKKKIEQQAARCMDCGVPFCHSGCPLGNIIPEFNDAVYRQNWEEAYEILSSTNNLPEVTGRICPAPCEASCVLGIHKPPVTIHYIEKHIAEIAYEKGWAKPVKAEAQTGKRVAVVGSGPAGLACAEQLAKAGHAVTIFERDDRIGGLLRYGIPDFKLDKAVIDRKLAVMEQYGITLRTNACVGENISTKELLDGFDAIALCGGSTIGRDLPIPGRDAKGVHFAMEFLKQSNKRVAGDKIPKAEDIYVQGADVVVIGGGDTGSDCVGTSNRHKAKSITQIELLPKPADERGKDDAWPRWPNTLKTSSSHDEGCQRNWSVLTKEFTKDTKGNLAGIRISDIIWDAPEPGKRPSFKEVEGTERVIPAQYAFLAIGFMHPQHKGMLEQLGVEIDERGNVKAASASYQTNVPKVFAAGDMRTGQSLVVRCISEGRECARNIDIFLMGQSALEAKSVSRFDYSYAQQAWR